MGLFRSLGRFFTGTKSRTRQIPRFNPAQNAALEQLLSRGMRDTDVSGLEQKYRNEFERDTVPGLAERFTSMGGGQRSSAFEESLRRGGTGLAEQLAGLRYNAGAQGLGFGLQPRFDTVVEPGRPGFLGSILGGLGGLGGLLGGSSNRSQPQVSKSPAMPMPGNTSFTQQSSGGQQGMSLEGLLQSGLLGGLLGERLKGDGQDDNTYMPGQPQGLTIGMNPVLRRILEGIQL